MVFCILFALLGITVILRARSGNVPGAWRTAMLKSSLLLSLYCWLSTELLSAFSQITALNIAIGWGTLSTIIALLAHRSQTGWLPPLAVRWRWLRSQSPRTYLSVLLPGVFLILPVIFLALYCPPSNYDSQSYHLVRVQFWIQYQRVAYFPTSFTVHNYYNVFAEYWLMHLQLLSGTDRFVNVVQLGAFAGSVLAATGIVRELGGNKLAQAFCGLLVCTLPMGILQSTTTQNDYLSGFFLLTTILLGLQQVRQPGWRATGWLGLSIALGGFTKYSYFLWAFPFVVWIGLAIWKRHGLGLTLRTTVGCAALLLVVFGPFWSRNLSAFDSLLSPPCQSPLFLDYYTNELLNWQVVLSNCLKNASLHLTTPFASCDESLNQLVRTCHEWLGLRVDHPTTTMGDYTARFTISEDVSGNGIHFALLMVLLLGLPVYCLRAGCQQVTVYAVCLLAGWFIYAAGFKWQLFSSRTQLPVFLAAAPPISLLLTAGWVRRWRLHWPAALMLCLAALPYVYSNPTKPLLAVKAMFRRELAYMPSALAPAQCLPIVSSQVRLTVLHNLGYRADVPATGWYRRPASPSGERQRDAYAQLRAIGYREQADYTIFDSRSRHTLYDLTPGAAAQWDTLSSLLANHHQIGLFLTGSPKIYPLWARLGLCNSAHHQVRYVAYPSVLDSICPRATVRPYTCILSNTSEPVALIPASRLKRVELVGEFYLIELNQPASTVYH